MAESHLEGSRKTPRPIGPERLKALRKAIESGTYPSDADVMGGLVRMFRPRPSSDDEADQK